MRLRCHRDHSDDKLLLFLISFWIYQYMQYIQKVTFAGCENNARGCEIQLPGYRVAADKYLITSDHCMSLFIDCICISPLIS